MFISSAMMVVLTLGSPYSLHSRSASSRIRSRVRRGGLRSIEIDHRRAAPPSISPSPLAGEGEEVGVQARFAVVGLLSGRIPQGPENKTALSACAFRAVGKCCRSGRGCLGLPCARLFCTRGAGEPGYLGGQFLDTFGQTGDVLARRNAEPGKGAINTFFEYGFEFVPGAVGLLLEFAGNLRETAADFAHPILGHAHSALLDRASFLDQRLENLLAFFLRFCKRAEAGQPDLLRRILDRRGKLVVLRCAFGHRLEFLHHHWLLSSPVEAAEAV